MTGIAKARVVGPGTFRRRIEGVRGGEEILFSTNRVSIVLTRDDDTGLARYGKGTKSPVPPADLPRISYEVVEKEVDHAEVELALITARKHGASHLTVDIDAGITARGGDSNYRMPKSDSSFMFGKHPSKIPRKN